MFGWSGAGLFWRHDLRIGSGGTQCLSDGVGRFAKFDAAQQGGVSRRFARAHGIGVGAGGQEGGDCFEGGVGVKGRGVVCDWHECGMQGCAAAGVGGVDHCIGGEQQIHSVMVACAGGFP